MALPPYALLVGAIVLAVVIVAAAVWVTHRGGGACSPTRLSSIQNGEPARPACQPSSDGRWALFRGAMMDTPQGTALRDSNTAMSDDACRAMCEGNPACKSWVNNASGRGGSCAIYPSVPATVYGMPDWTVGVRANAM